MRFQFHNTQGKETVKSYIDKCKDGQLFHVEIKKHNPKRTLPQNSLYWLYIACIMDETGIDRETLHYEFRRRFLPVKEGVLGKDEVFKLASTTELDTVRFTHYIERIVEFAFNDLGIILPDPMEQYFTQFEQQYKGFV